MSKPTITVKLGVLVDIEQKMPGETFIYDNDLYMAIDEKYSGLPDLTIACAFRFKDGKVIQFNKGAKVRSVRTEIIVTPE